MKSFFCSEDDDVENYGQNPADSLPREEITGSDIVDSRVLPGKNRNILKKSAFYSFVSFF